MVSKLLLKNGCYFLFKKLFTNRFFCSKSCLLWIWLNPWYVLFSLGFALIVFNEWMAYAFLPLRWPTLKCGHTHPCLKVLFVADPQILGEIDETAFARWDCDRYLHRTFMVAKSYAEPDIIVFLGDLMDEGSRATAAEYERYLARFKKIFSLSSFQPNQTIFLPGDNDIGGEDEPITKIKVERYKKHFGSITDFSYSHLEFIKVNKMLRTYPDVPQEKKENWLRFVLSHIPLLGIPGTFSYEALNELKPDFIFSAHDHKSVHLVGNTKTGERSFIQPLVSNRFAGHHPSWIFFPPSRDTVNEIIIPTCSYRMGSNFMAYATAYIDTQRNVIHYSLLTLPSRLLHLFSYLFFFTICFLVSIIQYLSHLCRQPQIKYVQIRSD
ncbi:metallophosphoesterase 1 homolog [Bemisia tabaci]|uniref:metallophosphoesterase 1 homolog n=1 Tax=Bemisia tabaci TaxID=7038 RepID=UPI0008F9C6C9|nr:PREDICTED: cell division control protein 1 [Bemisia tabaci]